MKIFELNACRGHHVLLMVAVIFVAENSTEIAAAEVAVATPSIDGFSTDTFILDSSTVRAIGAGSSDSALVLIQQSDETTAIKPNDVKEQFRRFITAYDIDLGGVSVEFDVGKGK